MGLHAGVADQLEDLLRRQFSTWEEVNAAQEDAIVTVSAWYLGEVQNRHYGTVWHANPEPPKDQSRPKPMPLTMQSH